MIMTSEHPQYIPIENLGGMWEIYERHPSHDTVETVGYKKYLFNGAALRLYKTEEAALKAIGGINTNESTTNNSE